MYRKLVPTLTLCLTVLLLLSSSSTMVLSNSSNSYAQSTKSSASSIPSHSTSRSPPTISTRGQFNMLTGRLNPGFGTTSYTLTGAPMPGLHNSMACPDTLIIFVHGVLTTAQDAVNNYNDIAPTLSSKGFVAIFSWDSDTTTNTNTNSSTAHIIRDAHTAETIGDQNAMKLAQFIFDYATVCPHMKIRLIAHSLGNRVVLQALNILNQVRIAYPDMWHTLITSVDLTAAGVPVSSVRPGGQFHDGLVMAADVHSYYSSEDSVLYLLELGDNLPSTNPALGHTDAHVNSIYSINVTSIVGADHHAYISSPKFMNLLIDHWDHRKLFGSANFGPILSSFCYPGIQQNCTEGKNFLLNIKNGSSICNPAFEKCSSQEVTKANTNYINERNKLTSMIESSVKPAVLTNLSNLLAKTFEGNSTAAKDFVSLVNSLKSTIK